jgi:hypothetical protein
MMWKFINLYIYFEVVELQNKLPTVVTFGSTFGCGLRPIEIINLL